MSINHRPVSASAATSLPWRRRFLTPAVIATCVAAWMAIASFVWIRDLLMVGPGAPQLKPTELLLTTQSMVLWGLLSPFILMAAQRLEFERGQRVVALLVHAALALVLASIDSAFDLLIGKFTHLENGTFTQKFYSEVYINTFSYILVAGFGYALTYQQRLTVTRIGALELQRELAQARLDSLARTLQPHFLFNALNTMAALVRLEDYKRALTAVVALSDLLRTVLKTRGGERVTLKEELLFTDHFVTIEKLRFEDRLEFLADIAPEASDLLVPALILQPLVENAIRHGVEHSGRGRVSIGASATADWLTVQVKVESLGESNDPKVAGLGIGLDVTRRRLACLYGEDRFSLDLLIRAGFSSVTLRLPHDRTSSHTDRG